MKAVGWSTVGRIVAHQVHVKHIKKNFEKKGKDAMKKYIYYIYHPSSASFKMCGEFSKIKMNNL